MTPQEFSWQPSLLEGPNEIAIDESFAGLSRIQLDDESWLDFAPEWVAGSEQLFAELVDSMDWGQRSRHIYDKVVQEPRLTSSWRASSGDPLRPQILEIMRAVLSKRYEIDFDSVGLNLYRDGRDSVARHRDKISKEVEDPIVVLVSIGERRKFLVRRYGGGPSQSFMLGAGDLLVTGGKFQREWEHSLPKVKQAGPRMSIAFRHGAMSTKTYDGAAKPSVTD
jgi:alkylated DNA repair dioxygenase AlkB